MIVAVVAAACGSDDGTDSRGSGSQALIPGNTPAIVVLAGNVGGMGSLDGTGTAARFLQPSAASFDSAGNLYIADGSTLRRLDPAGVVTTLAGSPTEQGSIDGVGSAARFRNLTGVAVDASRIAYVVDGGSDTIRVVTPSGVVSTLAGADLVPGSDDGPLSSARFKEPIGIAIDPASGRIYVANGDCTIRKISNGIVSTLAGSAGECGDADGVGTAARFDYTANIAIDASGNLFVTDSRNGLIRKITAAGLVTTFAGSASSTVPRDGFGTSAGFRDPFGIAIDATGTLFVSDFVPGINAAELRKITSDAGVTTLAGGRSDGSADGPGGSASFGSLLGLATDGAGTIELVDTTNFTVRRVSTAGAVTTVAGSAPVVGSMDGTGSAATFCKPQAVAVDRARNVYVVDACDVTIRKVTADGIVTTLAGKSHVPGFVDGLGSAARFNAPNALVVDSFGNLYVADGNRIRRVTSAGVVTTIAGTGAFGGDDGPASTATFADPGALALDAAGALYVGDGPSLRKIDASGMVITLAGAFQRFGFADGPGASAAFITITGITLDPAGNVYAADDNNRIIRKISASGVVSTFAGQSGQRGFVDGAGASARFTSPFAMASDAVGNLFVSDTSAHTICRIDRSGTVTTVVGVADRVGGVRLGALPGHLSSPQGLAIDSMGILYVADAQGVLRITLP